MLEMTTKMGACYVILDPYNPRKLGYVYYRHGGRVRNFPHYDVSKEDPSTYC